MILIALGANLPSDRHGPPAATLEAALNAVAERGLRVVTCSPWFESEPVPPSGQPWFVNGVAAMDGSLAAPEILALLHEVERNFGRVRRDRWEARVLDLDLIAVHDQIAPDPETWARVVAGAPAEGLVLPHPRMQTRRFVLEPLAAIAPDWRHPVLGATARELLGALPPASGVVRPLQGVAGSV